MNRPVDAAQVIVDAFRPLRPGADEVDVALDVIEGEIPAALSGVLFRNGAGRLQLYGTSLTHPFDGDGMVSRFSFRDGAVHYRNRFVRTDEFKNEERAQRVLYRNFGTNLPGGLSRNLLRLKFKNPANTSVAYHAGRLLALWEGGQPHALDPETLETHGRYDFDGELRSEGLARFMAPEPPFSAHPRRCAQSGELYNFGVQVAPKPTLRVYRIDPKGRLVSTRHVDLSATSFMHDFVLTQNYAVFFVTPVQFDLVRALVGFASPVESIRRTPGAPTEVLLVPRNGDPVRRIVLDEGFFLFHFFNAYEADDGRVVVDGCRMDDFPGGTVDLTCADAVRAVTLDPGRPTRWQIEPETGAFETRCLRDIPMELPTIDARFSAQPHRYGYATARLREGPPVYTGLASIDFTADEVRTRDFGPDLPGEPVLLPLGPGEGQGVLSTVVYRAVDQVSELFLLDPKTLETRARARLPHHQPPGFHGDYRPIHHG